MSLQTSIIYADVPIAEERPALLGLNFTMLYPTNILYCTAGAKCAKVLASKI
jgi:hypothetical protein